MESGTARLLGAAIACLQYLGVLGPKYSGMWQSDHELIASLQAHLALDASRRERRLAFSLSLAMWVLAAITAVLASVAIWP